MTSSYGEFNSARIPYSEYGSYLDYLRIQQGLLPVQDNHPADAHGTTLEQKPLDSPKYVFTNIEWEKRFTDLDSYSFQTKKVIHRAGKFFIASAFSLGGAAVFAARRLTAKPLTVIRVVDTLTYSAVFTFIIGIACLAKRVFKNDPEHKRNEGKKAESQIKNSDPSLFLCQIEEKYPGLFNDNDLHNFIARDIKEAKKYLPLSKNHGTRFLDIIAQNEESKEHVKKLFVQHILDNSLSQSRVEREFPNECRLFKEVLPDVNQMVVSTDAFNVMQNTMTYEAFRRAHGPTALELINPMLRTQYFLPRFLAYISTLNLGIVAITRNYSLDIISLTVTDQQLIEAVIPSELEKLLNNKIKYSEFQNRNGANALSSFISQLAERITELREYFKTLPFPEMELFFTDNKDVLALSDTMKREILRSDIEQLGYLEFRKKHGLITRDYANISPIKEKFVQMIGTLSFHQLPNFKADFALFDLSYQEARRQKLHEELTTISFEGFMKKYSSIVFDEGLISKSDPKIRQLVVGYVKGNYMTFFLGEDPYKKDLKDGLIPEHILQLIQQTQRDLNVAYQEYENAVTAIEKEYKVNKKAMEDAINDMVEQERKNLGIHLINEELKQIIKNINELNAAIHAQEIAMKNQKYLEGLETELANLKKTIPNIEVQNKLEEEISSLQWQIQELQNTTVSGYANAKLAEDKISSLRTNLNAKVQELASISRKNDQVAELGAKVLQIKNLLALQPNATELAERLKENKTRLANLLKDQGVAQNNLNTKLDQLNAFKQMKEIEVQGVVDTEQMNENPIGHAKKLLNQRQTLLLDSFKTVLENVA